jgi:hypothetical protein
VLYVYAITDSPTLPRRTGLQGASPRLIGGRAPFAVVTNHDDLAPRPSEEDLWIHESIVEDLMEGSTVLPMRFGSTVADEAKLQEILDERGAELEVTMERVQGAVELGVRAQLAAVESATVEVGVESPGIAYLRERAERRRRADDSLTRIHEPLAVLARRSTPAMRGLNSGGFKRAYLVDRNRVDDFRARVAELASEVDGASIVCTGPWPPYSFSSGEHE